MSTSFSLNESQQQAYDAIGTYKDLFISGPAGTGKSVIITEKVKAATDGDLILCALTNKAAKVLTDKLNTGVEITTVHDVLGMVPEYDGSTKVGDEITDFSFRTPAINFVSLIGKSLIIDEVSMMDLEMQNYIYELLEYGHLESVTFVGDEYQLPTVKGDPFDYDRVNKVIKLTQVQRAQGDLMDYYTQIRDIVPTEDPFQLYKHAQYFQTKSEFIEYVKNYSGSKVVVTYTNDQANEYSKLIDSDKPYVGQQCTALSQCAYQHKFLLEPCKVNANSIVTVTKLFRNYDQMNRTAINEDYAYKLPKRPNGLTVNNLAYVNINNERDEEMFISIWNGTEKERETLLLNYFTRTYRKIQDSAKRHIPLAEWNKHVKADGYVKRLQQLKSFETLPLSIRQQDYQFWNNFIAIKQALILRSIYVSTAHRAQGITVDLAAIDLDDLEKSDSNKLIYVAFTRAAKDLAFYYGGTK